ncbi:hypothetical protein FS837_004508 [Tulasnella sp. UAMH 9824]|nr:hypothetical protein FS837_004508 [Tulasnella sp. UAMH 9824]
MAAYPPNPLNPTVFEIPEPPEEFGQDGGKFYRCYDALAEEIDEDMTNGLKEQLDGLLIFAGLFAGVNSAFLALTLPLLSADPADDTNALLRQSNAILLQLASGRNDSLPTALPLPSQSFRPPNGVFTVNVLFSLSLTFALISSFLAVLGRQWLVYYRKRSGGGPDRQRWEQLKRFLGAERWRLELILDDVLPFLLQTGLIIFCVSLLLYLNFLNPSLFMVVGVPMYLGLAIFLASAACTVWDRFCPFHSPLSHFMSSVTRYLVRLAKDSGSSTGDLIKAARNDPWARMRQGILQLRPTSFISTFRYPYQALKTGRHEESPESLQMVAIKRSISTSEDPATLLHAAANIVAIRNVDQLEQLWSDGVFRERFLELWRSSSSGASQFEGGSQDLVISAWRLYQSAITHIILLTSLPKSETDPLLHDYRYVDRDIGDGTWISNPDIATSSPIVVRLSLFSSTLAYFIYTPSQEEVQDFCDHLAAYTDALQSADWKLLSVVSWLIPRLPMVSHSLSRGLDSLRGAYAGSVETVMKNLEKTFRTLTKRQDSELFDRDRVLVNILRCLNLIMPDRGTNPHFHVEQKFALLQMNEKVIRSPGISSRAAEAGRELRSGIVTSLRTTYMNKAAARILTFNHLDLLKSFLDEFRGVERNEMNLQEDAELLRIFTPMRKALGKLSHQNGKPLR